MTEHKQQPSVGRIVHFYDQSLAGKSATPSGINLNGQGAGPYPALIIQQSPGSPYSNLTVFAWGGSWAEGSVSEHNETNTSRYWVWPPRV